MEKLDIINIVDNYLDIYHDIDNNKNLNMAIMDVILDSNAFYHLININNNEINIIFNKIIGIDDKIIKMKLIPLISFLGSNFYSKLYEMNFFDDISESILSLIINTDFKAKSNTAINYINDKILYDDYNGICNFQHWVIDYNISFTKFIFFIAKHYFIKEYCCFLEKLDNITFMCFTYHLDVELLNRDYDCSSIDNKYFLLKKLNKKKSILAVMIFEQIKNKKVNFDKIEEIIFFISDNKKLWEGFLKININLYYEYLYENLHNISNVLSYMNMDKLRVLSENIPINFTNNKKYMDFTNGLFLKMNIELRNHLFQMIFDRWIARIECEEISLIDNIIFNVTDIIIYHIKINFNKVDILKHVDNLLEDINEIDNKWFYTVEEQRIYLDRLIIMLFHYAYAIGNINYKLRGKIKRTFNLRCQERLSSYSSIYELFFINNLI